MNSLFPTERSFPPGFRYVEDFITVEEEQELADLIAGLQLHVFTFRGFEAKRKVASYGYDYNFDTRGIREGEPIPEGFNALIEQVTRYIGLAPKSFQELLASEYPQGSVINWHRDAPPFGLIAGISLLSDCTFRLRPYEKAKQGRNSIISFPVKRRSLYIMQGEARSDWEHSISPVKQLRYSITLRTLK